MAKKPTVTGITSGYASNTQLNNNFTALRDAFDNTLSRDGSTPNSMSADIDLNSNDLLNVNAVETSSLRINGVLVSPADLASAGSVFYSNRFTGDGSTTAYTLSYDPYIKDNAQVYIDGVYQNKDSYATSGTTLTFTEAPPLNSLIEVAVARTLEPVGTADASTVTFTQAASGSTASTVNAKLGESISVKDFGATGDGVTDDYAAFEAARVYCVDNDVHSLLIPAASYHLSEPWFVPQGGNYVACRTIGNGAVLDNTVIAQNGAGISGLTVDGAADAGFVFTRGQGAYHEYLVSKNNGSYGFYFGVASRQHLTVADASNFGVGETVTGGTSGKTGVVERIDGNVLRLVKCNLGAAAGFFQTSETVTGGTSGASSTVSALATPYGGNYQVTRATFNALISISNGNKGFYWDGTATTNRSWMNATTWISPSSVSNGDKGWAVDSAFSGPGGGSQHNYNTFLNMNIEANADLSLQDANGRQNTYIGGHFVDTDGSGQSVSITDSFNFILGGRYIGSQTLTGVPFYYYNSDTSAIKSSISGLDSLSLTAPPFISKGWSILPEALVTETIAADNQTGHEIDLDMSDFIDGNYVSLRVTIGGFRNQSGGYTNMDNAQLNISMTSQSGSTTTHAVTHSVAATEGITVNSVTISSAGVITIDFDTAQSAFNFHKIVEYFDTNDTDAR